jgi:hypothetical protein
MLAFVHVIQRTCQHPYTSFSPYTQSCSFASAYRLTMGKSVFRAYRPRFHQALFNVVVSICYQFIVKKKQFSAITLCTLLIVIECNAFISKNIKGLNPHVVP